MNRIAFQVTGYPPAKSDGRSALVANHPHAARIHLLLEAAHKAQTVHVFTPIEREWVRLDVMLFGATEKDPRDALSYLSGIVEALQEKSDLDGINHLGDLGRIWLFRNSRQIRHVTYRENEGSRTAYEVSITDLGDQDRNYES